MKRENFYRRDPGAALAGMVNLTLEERGVYNTIIDLLYLTWRPLEDNRAYIAGHCGCAVQKLNPIIARLIAKRKLVAFEEDGQAYLSNPKFEEERVAVKGPTPTRSGRGSGTENQAQVGEKSGEVEEKSASVGQNLPVLDIEPVGNQVVTPLEKTREEKITPIVPKGTPPPKIILRRADVEEAWEATPRRPRLRTSRPDIQKALQAAARRGHAPTDVIAGLRAYYATPDVAKDGHEFAKGAHRIIAGDRWRDFAAEPVQTSPPDPNDRWRRAMRSLTASQYWNTTDDGPKPGRSGCLVPAEILVEFGHPPVEAGSVHPFPAAMSKAAA